ncbi:unnamed protein product [Chrysodeixis includens]|uniref:Uncharacterized protein n=1 Tax=Chrysodeixis includens TaxID=689277 RepID=A0A9N8L751_CHRIL|nr:unnamed protein product [Chrysodeixis includens]
MQKKICLILTLAIVYLVESSPVNLGTLEFDNLDTDLSNLKYEVEEEDLDDYSKLLDDADEAAKTNNEDSAKTKTSAKTSGFKKKNTENKGVKSKHNIADLKKFFKTAGVHDQGAYDDDDIYALAEGIAASAVGADGKETRTYKKGTKTRGFHRVHHKDEYKKDQEFYEDDETNGTVNKIGAKALGIKIGAGAGFQKGHFHHDRQKGIYGGQGYSDKGFLDKQIAGYSDSQGFDASFANES